MSRYFSILSLRIRSLFRKQTVDSELERELQLHFDELTAEYLAQGLSFEDATQAAKRSMGGVTQVAEECRDQRRMAFGDQVVQDFKHGARVLTGNRMFAVIGISTLALGIGANTLMFSVVQSLLFKPLPYREPSRLFAIEEASPAMKVILPPEFANSRGDGHAFLDLGAWNDEQFTLTGARDAQHIAAATVNANFFRTLGVAPALGRAFSLSEDGSNPERIVILSDAIWKSQFEADPKILGRGILLNSLGYRVVGVLPPEFRFPAIGQPDLYLPGGFSAPAQWNAKRMALLTVFGRLRPGMTVEQAMRELSAINERHNGEIPVSYRRAFKNRQLQILPLQRWLVGDLRPVLFILWGAVGLLLLLTCSNLTALQLARAFARSGEFAIRLAVGGDRRRLVQLLLVENLLLAATGACLGVAGAYALLPVVRTISALHLASPADLSINTAALLAAMVLTIGSAVLFGLGPAFAVSMLTPNEAMKSDARSIASGSWSDRARSALVTIQIALALVLVLCAGLLLKSAANILSNPLGLQPSNLLTAMFRVDPQRHPKDQDVAALGQQLVEKIAQIPGVESAGLTNALPFGGYSLGSSVVFEGRPIPPPGARPSVPIVAVTPNYLRTLQTPILAGRGIEEDDRAGSRLVAVVNRSFTNRFFADSDPVGRRLRLGADGQPWTEIVGIVADVRHRGQDADPEPEVYLPFAQAPGNALGLAIRSKLRLPMLVPAVRDRFKAIDPNIPVFKIVTMEDRISITLERRRIELFVIGGLSLLAFFIAVTGIYGVISYAVTKRTREFGVKLALGARSSRIATEVVTRGLILAAGGILPGLMLSYLAARYLSSLLYRVQPGDLPSYVWAAFILLIAIVAACFIPAHRASRIDPVRALRSE